jgi:hypothetical protein
VRVDINMRKYLKSLKKEYIPLEKIPILEAIQEEKPNLSFQVNILVAEEILQSSPKIQLVNIPNPSSPQPPHVNQPLGGQTMVGVAPPNPMDAIKATRYTPLVFQIITILSQEMIT